MDQVVGRLQAALASATSEVTLAAANINFDFSIVKYEAPEEFRPVGQLLSDRRKRDAEDGKSHTTARRLAALFAGVCPKTPALVRAYGKRASEIAAKAASKVSKAHFDSVFSQYTGVDATSMWAAATSSQEGADGGAIHVHLLACMLASAWDAPEATSIWVELVAERRHEIALEVDRGGFVPFATAAAAGQAEIPRQQLAEWDASARAWLEVANTVKKKDQTQLRLILQNIGLSIPSEGSVARNVIGAWSKAVTTMDNLISGIPQEVSDGSAIVGLMAWHIYPDIHVFGPRNVEVRMNDDLVRPGGILTLGCSPSATTPKSGITWSLSLSKLRFYGKSVRATTTVQEDASRLSANEFRLVLVGCLLRAWNMAPADDKTNIRLLGDLANTILQALQDKGFTDAQLGPQFCQHPRTWLGAMILLKKAADDYAAGEAEYDAFVTLGRNRPQYAPKPCGEGGRIVGFRPLFGMLEPSSFLSSLRGPEKRIDALRRIASRLPGLSQAHAVIRYITTGGKVKYARLSPLPANEHAQVASAGAGQGDLLQWVDADCPVGPSKEPAPRSSNQDNFSDDEMTDICYDSEMSDGNDSIRYDGDDIEIVFTASFVCPTGTRFRFLFGDSECAGIYLPLQTIHTVPVPRISADDLSWALQHRMVDVDLRSLGEDDPMLPWLSRFHYALACLQSLPEPVISVQTLRNDVQKAKWALAWDQKLVGDASHFYAPETRAVPLSKLSKLAVGPWKMPAKETFSVLAYFLSGCNVGPDELLDDTTGISFGNSIYVPTELLTDPFLTRAASSRGVTRILGNIGQPGLVMFSSVKDPMTAPTDDTAWRVVSSMSDFDGRPTDMFASTSMHLSFTQWERSMDMADSHGKRDVQFTKMESVISIREAGRWIGDVDVIAALRSPHIYYLQQQAPCGHSTSEHPEPLPLKSIDNWDELRECQSGLAVVRVHGNWLARLAVTAFLAQRADQAEGAGARITLLPPSVCWRCLKHDFNSNIYIY